MTLPDILGVNGSYFAFPTLKAAPSTTPAPGLDDGTMTVTFVQN